MPKFNLTCKVTVSAITEVEADTREEAMRIAACRQVVIGGPGSNEFADDSWIIDEADGEPDEITFDE